TESITFQALSEIQPRVFVVIASPVLCKLNFCLATPVLEALRALHHKYHTRSMERDPDVGKEQGVLTQDEVHLKRDLFESLRSSLLPSIKPHLSALLTALDLPRDAIQYPNPDIESILDILANLDQTVENAVQYINTAPLKPFGRKDPHDHHLGQCKTFRCFNLKTDISRLAIDIRGLFWTYIKLIESWNLPWDPTEDTTFRPQHRENRLSTASNRLTAQLDDPKHPTLPICKQNGEPFDYSLVKLANITVRHRKNSSVLREHVLEQSRLALPVNKLLRTLFNKISNTTTKNLAFTLDTELNSTTLDRLDTDPGVILHQCQVYAKNLEENSVLEALEDLLDKYHSAGPSCRIKYKVPTANELHQKNTSLDQLQHHLPSIQDQLGPLVNALGLRHNSSPNFELTCKLLFTLGDTWWQTLICIEAATLHTMPPATHDHHLKRCKAFNYTQLFKVMSCLACNFSSLFSGSILLMKASKVTSNYSETLECQNQHTYLLQDSATCSVAILRALELLQGSDFRIIQHAWQQTKHSPDPLLIDVTRLTHSAMIEGQTTPDARMKHSMALNQIAIPLIKLARTLSNKVSKTTTTKLPFTLDAHLNSETLTLLHQYPQSIEINFRELVRALERTPRVIPMVQGQSLIRHWADKISRILESTWLLWPSTVAVIFLAVLILPAVMANPEPPSQHSTCYNYFLGKDKCVFAAEVDADRCPAPTNSHQKRSGSTPLFTPKTENMKRSNDHLLERRYDTTQRFARKTVTMLYTCPEPQKPNPDGLGVCLWAGAGSKSTGWVNKEIHQNCGKQIYIQRKGVPAIYPNIIGGCDFGDKVENDVGCFNIALNEKLFEALKPTKRNVRPAAYPRASLGTYETMYETIYAIESALDTIPIHTQDHHFGRCKDFRTTHLMFSISTLIVSLQCIFLRSSCFIKAWERSTKTPKNAKYRTVTSRAGTIVLGQIVECAHLAGNISKWTQASDFQVIQDEWEKKAELLNPSLEIVMDLTQSRTSRRESITPLREHIIELAQSTATLIKLSRIFLTNISKNKPRKLPFTLDTVINSRHCPHYTSALEGSPTVSSVTYIGWWQSCNARRIGSLSISFDSILVLLAAYLVALPPGINHASLRTDFKAWLSVWQRSWHTAARHFTNVSTVSKIRID
ncbi:hypothetical protein PSHT_08702, partial [Puccinia striiformis]